MFRHGRWLITLYFALVVGSLTISVAGTTGCATFLPRPATNEVQQTRELAKRVANAIERLGNATEGVQIAEIALHDAKLIDDAEHRTIQIGFKLFATIVLDGIDRARAALSVPELKSTVTTITTSLTDLSRALAVKNPAAANVLTSVATAITAAFAVLNAIL